jgi:hypothetical protein
MKSPLSSTAGDTFCRVFAPSAVLSGGHVPFEGFSVAVEFKAVGAVGELRVAEAEGGVGADGALRGGESLFAVGVAEEERAPLL